MDSQSQPSDQFSPKCSACGIGMGRPQSVAHQDGVRTITYRCENCQYVWDETALHEQVARLFKSLPRPR